jgi:hypothetical protein
MSAVEHQFMSPSPNNDIIFPLNQKEVYECVKKAQYQSQKMKLDQQILPHQVSSRNLFIQDLTENIRVMTLQNKRKFEKVDIGIGISLRKVKQLEPMSKGRRLE